MSYVMTLEERPLQEEIAKVGGGLAAFNRRMASDDGYRPLAIFLRDAEGAVVGGLSGSTYWTWFSIDLLWIEDRLRGQGHGHRLLEEAEREAVRRGCLNANLDTLSFQAPAFYERHGYTIFGELTDFPIGHSRLYMVKRLVEGAS